MAAEHESYQNPLLTRYASPEMSRIWSAQKKHSTWRRLWVALAESERELGLDISPEQVAEMANRVDDVDFDLAALYEKEFRHDVMAHVHAFKHQCPDAGPIIHLGATSCFVTDNTELLQTREALRLIRKRLVAVIAHLAEFARRHRDLPCLGFTHLQPAQPTTVGKRATLWCYDLVLDLEEIEHRLETLRFRGVKGTTGTQASFLQLFNNDHEKVEELDRRVTEKMGFTQTYAVTGQTYPRKVDAQFCKRSAASPSRLTKPAPISGCCKAGRNWKNRSRSSKSVPPRWPTSETRCGPSECAACRGLR